MIDAGQLETGIARKADRRRRVGRWVVCVGAGMGAGAGMALLGGSGGLAVASIVAGLAIGHLWMIAPPGLPVLTYHSVSPDPAWLPWSKQIAVHPATLAAHLETLAAMRMTAAATVDLVDRRLAGGVVPRDLVALHFDDGYLDNWIHAVPLLRRHGARAGFFYSVDFVDPGTAARGPGADGSGYMNEAELRAIDADPLFTVEPHGIDHGRMAISDRVVDRLTPDNWRRLAWMQWAAMPGPKHDWYRSAQPPAVPIGSAVRESIPALAARTTGEDDVAYAARVETVLERSRAVFQARFGRDPGIFCWPENAVTPIGRAVAARVGYRATTGGRRRNTASEPAAIVSRIHIGDRALGFRWLPAERLRFRATVRLFQGNHYWYLILAPMDLTRTIVMRLRDRFGAEYS